MLQRIQSSTGTHKFSSPWEGPFIVSNVVVPGTYRLQIRVNDSASGSQMHPDSQTKAIVLRDEEPDKTALIEAELGPA